jgi:protein phosphatase
MRILAWGITDVGQKRDHNEDSFLICDDLSLFAVADGMGGHQGGDRASRLAVQILEREIRRAEMEGPCRPSNGPPRPQDSRGESGSVSAKAGPAPEGQPGLPNLDEDPPRPRRSPAPEPAPARGLKLAAQSAGRTIFNLAQKDPRLTGMGTTLTSLYFHNGRAYLAHVGDSRAYLYRDERIEQLTEDHSWIEEQVRSGFMTTAEAQESALKHIITRSVGFESDVEVDLLTLPFLMGDCFLLCSDGLSNHLEDEELRQLLSDGYYSESPEKLVAAANEKGGDDNITVVVVYVANDARVPPRRSAVEQETQRFELLDEEILEFDPYATTVVPDEDE